MYDPLLLPSIKGLLSRSWAAVKIVCIYLSLYFLVGGTSEKLWKYPKDLHKNLFEVPQISEKRKILH